MSKEIVVNLTDQTVTARNGSTVFLACECVSGDSAHATPKGRFTVGRKNHPYRSKTYDVQMDYAMFFNKGIALHQYHGPAPWSILRLGRHFTDAVGSHGCVRLQEDDAKKLYGWVTIGTVVEVR
jgi:lipoprotein-anchoring transpeptidase ErfK/SrfK